MNGTHTCVSVICCQCDTCVCVLRVFAGQVEGVRSRTHNLLKYECPNVCGTHKLSKHKCPNIPHFNDVDLSGGPSLLSMQAWHVCARIFAAQAERTAPQSESNFSD